MLCAACGTDLASGMRPLAGPGHETSAVPSLAGIPTRTLVAMAAGLAIATVIVLGAGLPNWIVATLATLSHEMGHATFGWLLAHPSIPSFDFGHGGGVTMVGERSDLLTGIYACGLGAYLWTHRRNRVGCVVVGIAGVVLAGLAFSDLGDLLILSGGHLGHIAIAGIFLFRGLTGVSVVHGVERWLYAVIGWTMLLQAMQMCWVVAFVPEAQDRYLEGKCGMDNDFVRIADGAGLTFQGVAVFHLVLSLLVPVGAWAVWNWRERLGTWIHAIARLDGRSS